MIRGLVPLAAMVAAMCALLAPGPKLFSQMASGNAKDAPVRPLPPGMKAPAVDFRDVAAQAGLTAEVISGEIDQTYLFTKKGLSSYILITSTNEEVRSKCEALSEQIRSKVKLP